MTRGLAAAGFEVMAAVELDTLRASTYQLNHPSVVMLNKDIRRVDRAQVLAEVPLLAQGVDLVAACPPCQGFSRIRRRNSRRAAADERNSLVLEVSRLVGELRPRALILENVPGLESDRRFDGLLQELKELGYSVDWGMLDAQHFGVPQRRKRVVLLAFRFDSHPRLSDIKRQPPRTVRDAIQVMPPLTERTAMLHAFRSKRSEIVLRRIRATPRDGGSRDAWPASLQLACHKGKSAFRDVYGRMAWDQPAPTITGGCTNPSKGRFLHPTEHRAISLVEAALLQSFPANYRYPDRASMSDIAEMIGEAVPPKFAQQLARYVRSHLLPAAARRS